MFRSVHSVDPSTAALSSAWRACRPGKAPNCGVRPYADQLHLANSQEEAARLVVPFDMALGAQNHLMRMSRELADALLASMPRRASCEDVAAAVRVLRSISAYGVKPAGRGRPLDRLA